MPTFGSFETNSESNAFDPFGTEKVKDTEMPTFGSFKTTNKAAFDPFGTEPERDTEMPTFGSFETSKKESFAPFGTETRRNAEMPTFEPFAPENSATEMSIEVKETPSPNSSVPVTPNLDQTTSNRNDTSLEVGHNVSVLINTSFETKQRQNERTSLSEALTSVRTLLKPIQGNPTTLNFDPNLAKVDIPPPVKFSKTPLAQELVTFCQQALKHTFVFQSE